MSQKTRATGPDECDAVGMVLDRFGEAAMALSAAKIVLKVAIVVLLLVHLLMN